jgi:hypothetical protein
MASGMYTLCGQACGAGQAHGAGNYPLMGLILQRALLLCWCTALPLLAAWAFAPQVGSLAMRSYVICWPAARSPAGAQAAHGCSGCTAGCMRCSLPSPPSAVQALAALGQEPELARLAAQYVWAKAPLLLTSGEAPGEGCAGSVP